MEYAAGRKPGWQARGIAQACCPSWRCAGYLLHVLQALEYVHLKGVLHLDIKCVCVRSF